MNHQSVNLFLTLGNDAFNAGDWETSIKYFKKVLQIDKDNSKAHNNLGSLYYTINKLALSLKHYDRALQLSPDDPSIKYNRSLTLLKDGQLKRGFDDYRYRWFLPVNVQKGIFPLKYVAPENRSKLWSGQDLTGKTILLYEEGGIGDIIQFMRYVDYFSGNCKLLVGIPDSLKSLYPQYEFYSGQPYDYHCPLMNLPTLITDIPTPGKLSYTSNLKAKMPRWKTNVGIFWRSRENKSIFFKMRNMAHTDLKPLTWIPDLQLHCLQVDLSPEEQQFANDHMQTYDIKSWDDTAALISQLDAVISIDTAVAHLAGTLGKPTLLTLPFTSEWRWQTKTEKSVWYPSMRIIRQKRINDWSSVVNNLELTDGW